MSCNSVVPERGNPQMTKCSSKRVAPSQPRSEQRRPRALTTRRASRPDVGAEPLGQSVVDSDRIEDVEDVEKRGEKRAEAIARSQSERRHSPWQIRDERVTKRQRRGVGDWWSSVSPARGERPLVAAALHVNSPSPAGACSLQPSSPRSTRHPGSRRGGSDTSDSTRAPTRQYP